jgi:hypothetical protein
MEEIHQQFGGITLRLEEINKVPRVKAIRLTVLLPVDFRSEILVSSFTVEEGA